MNSAAPVPHLRLVRAGDPDRSIEQGLPSTGDTSPLDDNLVIFAGAGTGKTYNLVTLCLRLLAGARRDRRPIKPHQLCLLTFTEKAAAEMRARLRDRLERLTRTDSPEDSEPELAQSFAQLAEEFPTAVFWRRLSDELGTATIGTFHSLCVQLLRRAPAGSGTDPAFEILEERESSLLLRDAAERTVLESLEQQDPSIVEICTELGFSSPNRNWGAVDLICGTLVKLREEGLDLDRAAIGDEKTASIEFQTAVDRLSKVAAQALSLDSVGKRKFGGAVRRCIDALSGMSLENFLPRFDDLHAAIASEPNIARQHGELGQALKELKSGAVGNFEKKIYGLRDFYGAFIVVRHERAFRALLGRADRRYREELRRRSALDFSAILIRTRDLLRDNPLFRSEVQARIGALLIDEFQDTNRLQLEIVMLLAERRLGGPRSLSSRLPLERAWGPEAIQQLPLEPGFLCVVGDRKQSIYEFRGADVSVFGQLTDQLMREGGQRAFLRNNWRSTPPLLDFFNRVFRRLMQSKEDARNYEIAYSAEDDLLATRSGRRAAPPVERICFDPPEGVVQARRVEADLLARRVCQLLRPDAPPLVANEDGSLRPTCGGDIAILFRRFSFLEVYRQALIRYRVPHRVVRGRGFYAAQEVLDIASFLTLLSDPNHAIALAAVLRSPFVALSDESLFRIAWSSDRRLKLEHLESDRWLGLNGLAEPERRRLGSFLRLLKRVRSERDRLGLRQILRIALEESGYRVSIAASPFGEQALANIEKLTEIASARDREGKGNCAGFSRELIALVDADPSEAQADVLEAGDAQAVELLTIHQAKGLEWPIVAVADLAAQRPRFRPMMVFDRSVGLAMRPWLPSGSRCSSPRYGRATEELGRREEAESLRLLYVAMSRARDQLILSGRARNEAGTWRQMIDAEIGQSKELRDSIVDLTIDELTTDPLSPPPLPSSEPAVAKKAEEILSRVRRPAPPQAKTLVFPVTQLQDFFLCPRRYFYAHRVGLSEFPLVLELDESSGLEVEEGSRSPGDARCRGNLAHRLLERVDWAAVSKEDVLRANLMRIASLEGFNASDEGVEQIIASVCAFLRSDFIRRVIAGGEGRIHRELPFLVRLGQGQRATGAPSLPSPRTGPAVHLKGRIDLLWENDEGGATVIDYKYTERHPRGTAPYSFQLACYALAAAQLVKPGLPIQSGIAFLRESEPAIELGGQNVGPTLSELEGTLIEGVSRLARLERGFDWPGLDQAGCEAIKCGYQYRCHARALT